MNIRLIVFFILLPISWVAGADYNFDTAARFPPWGPIAQTWSEHRSVEFRNSERRNSERRISERRISERRISERRISERRISERRSVEFRTVEEPAAEQQAEIDELSANVYVQVEPTSRRYQQVFRIRAEFEQQSALMVAGGLLAMNAPEVLVDLVRSTDGHVNLMMLVNDDAELNTTTTLLANNGLRRNEFALVPHNTMWARDYGPLVLADRSQTIVVDAAYSDESRNSDDAVPSMIAELSKTTTRHTNLSIPGGNLQTNGRGICVTTTRLQDENPGFSQDELANMIAETFEANTVAILEPLVGESTGHVDMFATFCGEATVVVGKYDDLVDPENAAILDRNAERLASIRVGSRELRVVRIPMPPRIDDSWPTFTNVVYANGRLLVPTYASTTDRQQQVIRRIYASLLPTWEIHFIRSDDLILNGGALHCVVCNLSTLSAARINGHAADPIVVRPSRSRSRLAFSRG